MSNLFGGFKTDELEKQGDRLGGFQVLESNIYSPATIKALYAGQSEGGAASLTLVADIGGGTEYKETFWVSKKPTAEQKAKNELGDNFFVKDGKKQPLPGFTTANDLCVVACEKELKDLDFEEKVIKLYDYEQKKEVPTKVMMATEAIGKQVALGILKVLEVKQKKNDQTGEYEDTDETREVNQIDKVFHPEFKVTVAEAREGKQEGEFWDKWLGRNEGKVRDKTGGKGKGSGSKGGNGEPPKKKASLFGNK